MATQQELHGKLKQLSFAQFEEVLFRLEIELWLIPGPLAEQSLRTTAVIKRLEQEGQNGFERLENILNSSAIKTIGKQYEGYETETAVKKIISDYLPRPLVGLYEEQKQLDEFLDNNSSGMLLVTAAAGLGESSLLMHWQQNRQDDCFIAFHCFRDSPAVLRSIPNAYRHLLRQLYVYYNRRDQQFPSDLRSQLRGLVDDAGAQPDKRLVIVIDGLDKAEDTLEPFLSSPLPQGVYVIASARTEGEEKPDYLQGWTDNATQQLTLSRLSREVISDQQQEMTVIPTSVLTYREKAKNFIASSYGKSGKIDQLCKNQLECLRKELKISEKEATTINEEILQGCQNAYVKLQKGVQDFQKEVLELFQKRSTTGELDSEEHKTLEVGRKAIGIKKETAVLALSRLGEDSLEKGNLDKAAILFKEAMAFNSNDISAHIGLGSIQLEEGKAEEAQQTFSRAKEFCETQEGSKKQVEKLEQLIQQAEKMKKNKPGIKVVNWIFPIRITKIIKQIFLKRPT